MDGIDQDRSGETGPFQSSQTRIVQMSYRGTAGRDSARRSRASHKSHGHRCSRTANTFSNCKKGLTTNVTQGVRDLFRGAFQLYKSWRLAIRHQTDATVLASHVRDQHHSGVRNRRSTNAFLLPLACKLRSGVERPCEPSYDGRTNGGRVAED
jgi:hypothetical protein